MTTRTIPKIDMARDIVAPMVALGLIAANAVAWSSIFQTIVAW